MTHLGADTPDSVGRTYKPVANSQDTFLSPSRSQNFIHIDHEPDSPSPVKKSTSQSHLQQTLSLAAVIFKGSPGNPSIDEENDAYARFPATQKTPFFTPCDSSFDFGTQKSSGSTVVEIPPPVSSSKATNISTQKRCPMCRELVSDSIFNDFGPMNIRQQERFCRHHQTLTALSTWDSRAYPDIDWENLDRRLRAHNALIRKLIEGKTCPSRQKFASKIATGKERTLIKSTDSLTPGYYGGRGLRAMSEFVMERHTRLLQQRAITDALVSARGAAVFVQHVVVPELATKLIAEDMTTDDCQARQILHDSIKIGELVNDELQEELPDHESEEDF